MRTLLLLEWPYRDPHFCEGALYQEFLDYAFSQTDFFMLVYARYKSNKYSQEQKFFKKALRPFQVKSRTEKDYGHWPGTQEYCENATYHTVFYRTDLKAKEILARADGLNSWKRPWPGDLCFFKGNRCWFCLTCHEQLATVIDPSKDDVKFFVSKNLAIKDSIRTIQENDCAFAEDEDLLL